MNDDKPTLSMKLARYYHADQPLPTPKRSLIDYITAGNGVWKRAVSDLFYALVPVVETAPCKIAGLRNLDPQLIMRWGKLPPSILIGAIECSRKAMPYEAMFHVRIISGKFYLVSPEQCATQGGVAYRERLNYRAPIVMDLHSHHTMRACFSATDDRDELGFRLYCTIGRLQNAVPEVVVRLGVYGDWLPLRVIDVFDFGTSDRVAARAAAAFVEDTHGH